MRTLHFAAVRIFWDITRSLKQNCQQIYRANNKHSDNIFETHEVYWQIFAHKMLKLFK